MKKMTIRWQRLLDYNNQTCPRCSETAETVESAFIKLKAALMGLGVEVELVKESLDILGFNQNTLQSNSIWINGKLIEEWFGGETGKSKCCDICGDSDCRTISFGENTFESIPENLIIKAGLIAAADLIES